MLPESKDVVDSKLSDMHHASGWRSDVHLLSIARGVPEEARRGRGNAG